MSHTFSLLLYHIVFSTQDRADLINPELRQHLHPYLAAIVRNERGALLMHEDRGMMQLIEVTDKPVTPYEHH